MVAICKTDLLLVFIPHKGIRFLMFLAFAWWEVTPFNSFTNFFLFLTVKKSKCTGEKASLQRRRKYISGNLELNESHTSHGRYMINTSGSRFVKAGRKI